MGIEKIVIRAAAGKKPVAGNLCTVHCTGFLKEGKKKFWSTKDPGQEPFKFKVGMGQVIRGWDEGVLQMKEGELAEISMTGDYAYGSRGFPHWGIGPNASLIFEIELLSIR